MDQFNDTNEFTQLVTWLEAANLRYREADIPVRKRPFEAMHEFSLEFNRSIVFGSPLSNKIFNWFYDNSKPGSHQLGPLFIGSYYFDSCFWQIQIPIAFGTVFLTPMATLETMPEVMRIDHVSNLAVYSIFDAHWLNCCNYAYGIERLKKSNKLSKRAKLFFQNADKELTGSISQINGSNPNAKAILSLRLACEIFLKAILVQEQDFSNKELKKYSHKLGDAINMCSVISNNDALSLIADQMDVFPILSDRYDGELKEYAVVWQALQITQKLAASVINYYVGESVIVVPEWEKARGYQVRTIL